MAKEPSHHNIYESHKEAPPPKETYSADVEPLLELAKERRRGLFFLLGMIALLGGVTLFVYLQGKRSERPDLAGLDVSEFNRLPPTERTGTVTQLEMTTPDFLQYIDSYDPDMDSVSQTLDSQRVADAMQEVRIAARYMQAKEWLKAEQRVRQALSMWPDMAVAQRMLGSIYTQRGEFDKAIAVLEKALETDPFNAEAYNNLAAAYMHRGKMRRAENLLQNCLRVQPDFAVAKLNLGLLYLAAGQYEWSRDYLLEAIDYVKRDASVRNNLAVVLMRTGDYDEARNHFRQVIAADPNEVYPYFNLAISYALQRNFEEAVKWVETGAQRCSPLIFQEFMADDDFAELRRQPIFRQKVRELYGNIPELTGG